jgi:hypothetical protein
MRPRFTLYRRGNVFYCQDTETGKQSSLRTGDKDEAQTLLNARNEAFRQPAINRQIARAYLTACDPEISKRTWQDVMNAIPKLKTGSTKVRWESAINAKAFDPIRALAMLETRGEHSLRVLETGGVSINSYLRRIHTFAAVQPMYSWLVVRRHKVGVVEIGEILGVGNVHSFIGPEAPEIGCGVGSMVLGFKIEFAAAVINRVDVVISHAFAAQEGGRRSKSYHEGPAVLALIHPGFIGRCIYIGWNRHSTLLVSSCEMFPSSSKAMSVAIITVMQVFYQHRKNSVHRLALTARKTCDPRAGA